MVWAICGRMPLMMQSAPIEPGRGHRLDQVLGHQRVHGRHAGDVEDGDVGARVDDPLQQALHDDLGAGAVQGADQRQGQDAVPQLDDRRGELQHLLLLALDDLLAGFLVDLGRVQPQLSSSSLTRADSRARTSGLRPHSRRTSSNKGFLSEKTKVAVSEGEKP